MPVCFNYVCACIEITESDNQMFMPPSVRNSVPLTHKVQYLKFGRQYSNQTLIVC